MVGPAARAPMAPKVPVTTSAPVLGAPFDRLLMSAIQSHLGSPYHYAGTGPDSFDCSGLVMQAFAQVGIKLPHYTGTMIKFGKKVSRSELQRGDILFPSSGHVVIYLGNGKQVAASSGKGKVVIQNVSSFYAARRLV